MLEEQGPVMVAWTRVVVVVVVDMKKILMVAVAAAAVVADTETAAVGAVAGLDG